MDFPFYLSHVIPTCPVEVTAKGKRPPYNTIELLWVWTRDSPDSAPSSWVVHRLRVCGMCVCQRTCSQGSVAPASAHTYKKTLTEQACPCRLSLPRSMPPERSVLRISNSQESQTLDLPQNLMLQVLP